MNRIPPLTFRSVCREPSRWFHLGAVRRDAIESHRTKATLPLVGSTFDAADPRHREARVAGVGSQSKRALVSDDMSRTGARWQVGDAWTLTKPRSARGEREWSQAMRRGGVGTAERD